MRALFRNKYVIGSKRCQGYDYSSPGKYFITICTKNRIPFFGKIENGKIVLSELGNIAKRYWQEIPNHFEFTRLDEFIVMPNHIHGIIIINPMKNIVEPLHATDLPQIPQIPQIPQRTQFTPSQNFPHNTHMSMISPKTGSLGSVIRSFKSITSKNAHHIDAGFEWQYRYYDHIIRSQTELFRIRKYIILNPLKWNDHATGY